MKMRTLSLKKRIQRGMVYSSLLSIVIFTSMIALSLFLLTIPISQIISHSVSSDIYNRITVMESRKSKPIEVQIPVDQSVSEFASSINAAYKDSEQAQDPMLFDQDMEQINITTFDETNQKIVIGAIYSALSKFNEDYPLKQVIQIDPILVEFSTLDGETLLSLPDRKSAINISAFNHKNPAIKGIGQSIYNQTHVELELIDQSNSVVAYITATTNPVLVLLMILPLLSITLVVSLLAFLITKVLTKFHASHIIRPITHLNHQMEAIAQNEFIGLHPFEIDVKKPPEEVLNLITSARTIMDRLNDNNDLLEAQKEELEAQNLELEAQNTALYESRSLIQSQQDQLVRSEKMAVLGQISAAIAHEINTPLGAIKSNAQMIEHALSKVTIDRMDTTNQNMLEKINQMNSTTVEASNRMSEIIRSLKNFSRIDQSEFQDFDVHEGLESVLLLTSNLWKNKVSLVKKYATLPLIQAYPGMLNQVFMNIIVNGIQAIADEGVLTIETACDPTHVMITISDTGTGIAQDHIDKVFDSGFTTKLPNQGTGLGLSISKDIMMKHKGHITVKSDDKGATFTISLPRVQPQ